MSASHGGETEHEGPFRSGKFRNASKQNLDSIHRLESMFSPPLITPAPLHLAAIPRAVEM